ncbi:MAG: MFS transporter, partial [Novosphingobium sp.]|nr:MFS transporter [Novosphingobium sp.]
MNGSRRAWTGCCAKRQRRCDGVRFRYGATILTGLHSPSQRRDEWLSGWPLVLTATIGVAIAGIHYQVVGAIMRPLGDAYGWSRGEISLALTISSLIAPFANIGAGYLSDRYGPRAVVLTGALLFGVTYALFGLSGPSLWSWYAVSIAFSICAHLVGPVAWTMAIVRHFDASRGLALAISLSGSGVLVSLIPTIVLVLVGSVGVRGTFFVIAAGASALMFLPALFLFKEPAKTTAGGVAAPAIEAGGISLKQAIGGTMFWRFALALTAISLTVGLFIVHFQPILVDSGLTPGEAASAAFALGPMMVAGRIGTGYLIDRFPPLLVAAVAFALPVLGCVLLLNLDGTLLMAVIAAIVLGLGSGAEVDVMAYLTTRYFGLRHYGKIYGVYAGIYGLGVGAGATIAGGVNP